MPIKYRTVEESEPLSQPGPGPTPQYTQRFAIPPGQRQKRPPLTLDPLGRMKISRFAKWILLLAILLTVAWLPPYLFYRARESYWFAEHMSVVFFAAVFATGLPRVLLPSVFGRWREPVEAFRDWLVVGLVTGVLYWLLIQVSIGASQPRADTYDLWFKYRFPLILVSGAIGLWLARMLAIRNEGVMGTGVAAIGQILLQVAIIALPVWSIKEACLFVSKMEGVDKPVGIAAGVCAVVAFGILAWAYSADRKLIALQRQGRLDRSGVSAGTGPVEMKLTIIGGTESGKTAFLAAAYNEWSTQDIGNLRITPAGGMSGDFNSGGTNLDNVAHELYSNFTFPPGTIACQNLPFDLALGKDAVARFNFLDYPGGALGGRSTQAAVEEFWSQVDTTDGVVLIADMSFVRRNQKDTDWMDVRKAYREVMRRMADRNGSSRVVPIALVLTKCDEFVNQDTGRIDVTRIEAGLQEFLYSDLEREWTNLNSPPNGPGFIEFTTWITTAITYSEPQLDADGQFDFSKPFKASDPPPSIEPRGCASPLLWITAKVMHWNATMFCDLSTFLFGSSPKVRRRLEAVEELERIADARMPLL